MKMNTNELIARLAEGAMPVRRLPPPSVRTLLWLAVSLPFVAAIVVLMPEKVNLAQAIVDEQFLVEEFAILATALAAAVAAFCSVIPGYDRRIVMLPLVPLAVWLASLGQGCVQDWIRSGASGLQLRPDWECLLPAVLIGIVPATAMVVMLRRGAPLLPGVTLALGALAVAALTNFGLRLFHFGDASIMVLFWHFGGVGVLSVVAASLGRYFLRWHHTDVPAIK
jgi:hypothetical protein